ncbi:MAG: glucuronate isomerase [Clostridia bacterium]|nr:glucuronate isomerase [Clostridia bacterium]
MKLIRDDFMLHSATAEHLFHDYAESLPIIDYHCHLSPGEIAADKRFRSVTELMLGGDHYKWRFMRSAGVTEDYITGDRSDEEKFRAWATVLPYAVGNPLYHWTHLELKRYFDVDIPLTAKTADRIYKICGDLLASPEYSARSLIRRSGVEVAVTTDDPVDDLHMHALIAGSGFGTRVLPAFRPDKSLAVSAPDFPEYIAKTGVRSYDDLVRFLCARIEYFHEHGARVSDHGMSTLAFARGDAAAVFEKRMNGGTLTPEEDAVYRTELFLALGRKYAEKNWAMQLHLGATRNNNSRMFRKLGPDSGFDGVGDLSMADPLAKMLDALDTDGRLPKTILYALNPKDYYMLGAMIGNFQEGPVFGKLQLGSGWWFCDQRDGMEGQLRALANLGCLGSFVGMLTDSRSFVSYPRHEYFRRIFCNLLGKWVEDGEYPRDEEMLETIVTGVCHDNAARYFGF